MNWDTGCRTAYQLPTEIETQPYAIADVRYANGADNEFVNQILSDINLKYFYGYSAWNTSANTIGSLLANIKIRYNPAKYNENAFKKLQIIRFLDDWAYQANVRKMIDKPSEISNLMKPFESKIIKSFNYEKPIQTKYNYPWNRKFEIEVNIS